MDGKLRLEHASQELHNLFFVALAFFCFTEKVDGQEKLERSEARRPALMIKVGFLAQSVSLTSIHSA